MPVWAAAHSLQGNTGSMLTADFSPHNTIRRKDLRDTFRSSLLRHAQFMCPYGHILMRMYYPPDRVPSITKRPKGNICESLCALFITRTKLSTGIMRFGRARHRHWCYFFGIEFSKLGHHLFCLLDEQHSSLSRRNAAILQNC